jgi:hypothetical protein
MDPIVKDAIASVSWLVASIGGVAAALWAVIQFQENRRWKQSELARNVVDAMWADPGCRDAMVMIDWSNRQFTLHTGDKARITRHELVTALRTDHVAGKNREELRFKAKEVFIRDCFDSLLDGFQRLQHYIDIKLIRFDDVEQQLDYAVAELSGLRPHIDGYMQAYEFVAARKFLRNYEYWKEGRSHARAPCFEEA